MSRVAIAVPPQLARRANQVLRPRDAADVYANPRAELRRLTGTGAATRLATGYYAMVPRRRLGDHRWQPELAAVALGIAQADYGVAASALVGVSAARHHGAIPRAVSTAAVAIPKQRPPLTTIAGTVVFSERRAERLDLQKIETELTAGWVTTAEQTLLDLAAHPTHAGLTPDISADAVRALSSDADWTLIAELARAQHRPAALERARRWVADA